MKRVTRHVAPLLLAVSFLATVPGVGVAQKRLSPSAVSLVGHDANRAFLRVSNRGGIGLAVSNNDAGNFPRGTLNRYIFGAGLWVGGFGDVDADGNLEPITTIGYNPSNIAQIEWIEGALGFNGDDPLFRVLNSSDPADQADFPTTPVADQELFTIYSDRFSVFTNGVPSIPLGLEIRQRSFAFDESGLDGTIFFQWDFLNVSGRIRSTGYTIQEMFTGIVLDPDIAVSPVGSVSDDTAAPLTIDGVDVLLIWDSDFSEPSFDDRPGFLAVVPLENPGGMTTITQLTSSANASVLPVPVTDATQYQTMAGIAPRTPTIAEPGFDLRALIAWGVVDLPQESAHRTAAAFVFAPVSGLPPDVLSPLDPDLNEDLPVLANLVAAVRATREAYDARLRGLPALLDFPGDPPPPPPPSPGDSDAVLQNFPNPFTDRTTIQYRVVESGAVTLRVYDLSGREIATLANGVLQPDNYTATWDGLSTEGIDVPAGIYVVRLETPRGTSAVRVLKSR